MTIGSLNRLVATLAVAVVASVIGVSQVNAASPSGYQMPECTAGADFICAANGWPLSFSGGSRYNALSTCPKVRSLTGVCRAGKLGGCDRPPSAVRRRGSTGATAAACLGR